MRLMYADGSFVSLAVGEAIPGFGYSDSYIAQDFRCNGTEYELQNCNYTNATERCNGQHIAGFRCRESELITNTALGYYLFHVSLTLQ